TGRPLSQKLDDPCAELPSEGAELLRVADDEHVVGVVVDELRTVDNRGTYWKTRPLSTTARLRRRGAHPRRGDARRARRGAAPRPCGRGRGGQGRGSRGRSGARHVPPQLREADPGTPDRPSPTGPDGPRGGDRLRLAPGATGTARTRSEPAREGARPGGRARVRHRPEPHRAQLLGEA